MNELNPAKLYVRFGQEITPTEPIIPRRYTLTHLDETGELFLTIASFYDSSTVTEKRDEVIAEWTWDGGFYLFAQCYLDSGECDFEEAALRSRSFVEELPLALEALRYGDCQFFLAHPELDFAPIFICFLSIYPELQRTEYWGVPNQYSESVVGIDWLASVLDND